MPEIRPETARRVGSTPNPKVGQVNLDHYLKIIWHRKWIVLGVIAATSAATAIYVQRLPDIYSSETLILVDPQKVPDSYVKSTVTGDVRNRLGTLSQQILSATRLQKIIDSFNLYPEERKTQAREDIITKMRADIRTGVASEFGGSQDLQAFRISYRGRDPRLVAQVANQLAALFIDENLKAREEQATGTTEFLSNQLEETRKALNEQETKLKEFKLRHLGEMPEQQTANLQILGQLQAQLQLVNDSIGRLEQQKSVTQSMMAQGSPTLVEVDDPASKPAAGEGKASSKAAQTPLEADKARLQALLDHGYTQKHPTIVKLKARIAEQEAAARDAAAEAKTVEVETAPKAEPPVPVARKAPSAPATSHYNPVLQAQLDALNAEIAKQREEQRRLSTSVAGYRGKVEAIPVREQEIAELQRDYEMSKAHYAQLLDKQLSAQTATQLEIRQKGEKFTVLDPAVPADRPSSPNRPLTNLAGLVAGIVLGIIAAVSTELVATTIIDTNDVPVAAVLEIIPVIQTRADRKIRRRWLVFAAASAVVLICAAALLYLLGPGAARL